MTNYKVCWNSDDGGVIYGASCCGFSGYIDIDGMKFITSDINMAFKYRYHQEARNKIDLRVEEQ